MREASDDDGAFHDVTGPAGRRTLTGLADGQHIFDTIFAEARRPDPIRAGQLMAVMVIEIDDAEAGAGGDALTAVGDRIRRCLRPDDAAAMLGGHQFLALLRDVPDVSTARATAQRIIDLLAHPDQFHDSTTGIRATIGLSVTDARSEVTSLFRQADTALSAAKVRGDGRWLQYHEGMSVPTGVLVEARRVLDAAFHERR